MSKYNLRSIGFDQMMEKVLKEKAKKLNVSLAEVVRRLVGESLETEKWKSL